MFDGDVGELDSGAALAAAADLHALTRRAEARLLQVAAHWADLNSPGRPEGDDGDGGGVSWPGEERYLVQAGDGCPRVGEFACAELGAALGMSSRAAAGLISDALGLRHRMPRLWAGMLAGRVEPWRARRIANACVTLSREAAGIVDAQLAGIADRVGRWRLRRIIDAAILAVDPERAQANADEMARQRGVWVGQSDSYGTKAMTIKAAAGDVARLDARIDQIADILADLGDLDNKDLRRAKAIGWLADPHSALELLIRTTDTADTPDTEAVLAELEPRAGRGSRSSRSRRGDRVSGTRYEVYVHLTDHTLATGTGVLRTETAGRARVTGDDLGPLLASQLAELLGPNPGTIIVRPVIDLRDQLSVDGYEIPERIRQRVRLRYLTCYFPWCDRPAIRCDLDHISPFVRDGTGPPGQTSTENLAPGCRLHHRIKTDGGWAVERLPDGAFVWTSPHGHMYLVDHTGTRLIHTATNTATNRTTGDAAA